MSNSEIALLGLLAERPRHPYEVEKEVRARDMRSWTDLSMSSIYKLLKKLESELLVCSSTELSDQNRARRIYEITDDGLAVLREHVRDYLSSPELQKSRMDVAISNLAVIPVAEAVDCLNTYRAALVERIQAYRALEDYLVNEGCPTYRLAFARRPIRMIEGEVRWVDEFTTELSENEERSDEQDAD